MNNAESFVDDYEVYSRVPSVTHKGALVNTMRANKDNISIKRDEESIIQFKDNSKCKWNGEKFVVIN